MLASREEEKIDDRPVDREERTGTYVVEPAASPCVAACTILFQDPRSRRDCYRERGGEYNQCYKMSCEYEENAQEHKRNKEHRLPPSEAKCVHWRVR